MKGENSHPTSLPAITRFAHSSTPPVAPHGPSLSRQMASGATALSLAPRTLSADCVEIKTETRRSPAAMKPPINVTADASIGWVDWRDQCTT